MVNKHPPASASGTVAGALALLIWCSHMGVSRSLVEKIGVFTAASLIFLIGGLLSCLLLAATDRRSFVAMFRLPWKSSVGCGALFVGHMICIYAAVGYAGDRIALLGVGLLNYLWPTFIILFSLVLMKFHTSWGLLPGIILATLGTALAVTGSAELSLGAISASLRTNAPAFILAFAAAIFWGLYSAASRRYCSHRVSAVPLYLLGAGFFLFLVHCAVPEPTAWNGRAVGELCFMALLPTFLAYKLWEIGLRRGRFIFISALSYFVPVISTLISCAYLVVLPDARIWVGSVFVALGAYICKRSVRETG